MGEGNSGIEREIKSKGDFEGKGTCSYETLHLYPNQAQLLGVSVCANEQGESKAVICYDKQ